MPASTQDFLPFEEIRDDVVLLPGGQARAVLASSSLNLDLMKEEEKSIVVSRYQSFLNSLDFPIQVVIQSRPLNLNPYLRDIKEAEKEQKNELLTLQAKEYREFVYSLKQRVNLLTKNFYVIVPFFMPAEAREDEEAKKRWEGQLEERVSYIIDGLNKIDIRTTRLKNPELKELLWSFYNRKEAEIGVTPEFPAE